METGSGRELQVVNQLNTLESHLEELSKAIKILGDRLTPVSCPPPPKVRDVKDDATMNLCVIAEIIGKGIHVVDDLHDQITSMTEGLQV